MSELGSQVVGERAREGVDSASLGIMAEGRGATLVVKCLINTLKVTGSILIISVLSLSSFCRKKLFIVFIRSHLIIGVTY